MNNLFTTTEALIFLTERGRVIKGARLRHLLQQGRIPGAIKFGRDWSIPKRGLLLFLKEGNNSPIRINK